MPKTWAEKLRGGKPPHVEVLTSAFGGLPIGAKMVVLDPKTVDAYVRQIPPGETRTANELRADLARRYKADGACPISTGIFLRIVAENATDELEAGKKLDEIAPFWRAVEPGTPLAKKLRCGEAFLSERRREEAVPAKAGAPHLPAK